MKGSNELPCPQSLQASRQVTHDAVVVVPGITGERARRFEHRRGPVGAERPAVVVRARCRDNGLVGLAVTEDELAGDARRVRPNGLLRFPAFAPFVAGIEPYTDLVTTIRRVISRQDAVLEFAYDWRLSVTHNAKLLAAAAGEDPRTTRSTWPFTPPG